MKKEYFIKAVILFTVVVTTFSKSVEAQSRVSRNLQVGGDCATYFRGGQQVRNIHGSKRCTYSAEVATGRAGAREKFIIIISRRFPGDISVSTSSVSNAVTVKRSRAIKPDAQGRISGKFIAQGKKGAARYSLRIRRLDFRIPETNLTCAELEDAFIAETYSIRSCVQDSDCGQPLPGTSCGCTMDWVARNDADTTQFYSLLDQARSSACAELIPASICICPEVSGYGCNQGMCGWIAAPYGGDLEKMPIIE